MFSSMKQLIERMLPQLYTPQIKRACQYLELHETFISFYHGLLIVLTSVGYWFAPEIKTMSVRDIRAEFHIGNRIEYDRVTTMIGEKAILKSFFDEIKEDDLVWDVGANIGTYSVFAGLKATKGSVTAFEPHPQNAHRIKENISLNGIENIHIKRAALGAEDGSEQQHIHGNEIGGGQHSLVDHGDDVADVDLVRGDSVSGSTSNVIKIDVEGAELDVLDGMVETLPQNSCRVLFIEVHHEHGVSVDDVAERINTAGFTFEKIDKRGGTTFLQATKTS